jgi:hypothetical protein
MAIIAVMTSPTATTFLFILRWPSFTIKISDLAG